MIILYNSYIVNIYFIFFIYYNLDTRLALLYILGMIEKKPVQIFSATHETIDKNKGDRSIATFIDDAVNFYVRSFDDETALNKINQKLDSIDNTVKTNLGLNCEVLRQAGILNGNGEISALKKN